MIIWQKSGFAYLNVRYFFYVDKFNLRNDLKDNALGLLCLHASLFVMGTGGPFLR